MTTNMDTSSPDEDESDTGQCEECGKEIKTKRAMLAHLDRHGSTAASCRSCHRTFNSLHALSYHFKAFCGRQKVQCPQCKALMPSTCYNSHVEAHMRNNCLECPSLFTNRKHLVAHMAEVHNVVILADAAFPCTAPGCDKNFVKRSTLFHHMQLRHAAQGEYVCLSCGTYVDGKEAFHAHVALHKKWTCQECHESFTRRQQFLVHKIRHEQNIYRCVTCDQNLPTKLRVLEHRNSGHEVTGLLEKGICSECGERFYTRQELRCHASAHKVKASVTCDDCSKTFSNQKALASHKCKAPQDDRVARTEEIVGAETSQMTDGHICEQCGKHFKIRSLLDKHLNYVHREKNRVCNFCDYRTYYDVNLRRHLALHMPQPQQFVCDQCGASFKALSTLKDHNLFVHSDERNFQCEKCNKTFKRRTDLNRHSRSHSDQREYVCHCKQTYKFIAHLRRHQKAAHKNVPDEAKNSELEELGELNPADRSGVDRPNNVSVTLSVCKDSRDCTLADLPVAPVETAQVTLSSTDTTSFSPSGYQDLTFVAQSATLDPNQPHTFEFQLPVPLSQLELVHQVENLINLERSNGQQPVIQTHDVDVVFGSADHPNEAQDSVLISLNVAKAEGLSGSISCGNDQPIMVPHAEMATMTEFMSHQLGLVGAQDVAWSGDLEEGLALSVFN